MAEIRWFVTLRSRQGDVRPGLTVQLIDATSLAVIHTLTEAADHRGMYYLDYTPPDTRLYRIKINGTIDTDRGPFYLDAGGAVLGGSSNPFCILAEAAYVGQPAYLSGYDVTTGYPVAGNALPAANKSSVIGVLAESAQAGITVRYCRSGILDTGILSLDPPAGTTLVVGTDGYPAYQGSANYPAGDQYAIKLGYATGDAGIIYVELGAIPQ